VVAIRLHPAPHQRADRVSVAFDRVDSQAARVRLGSRPLHRVEHPEHRPRLEDASAVLYALVVLAPMPRPAWSGVIPARPSLHHPVRVGGLRATAEKDHPFRNRWTGQNG
jgi:hypothetical protein